MKAKHSYLPLAAALLLAAFLAAQPARSDEIKIKIPPPPIPKIVLPAPPPMIWLPGISVYVAHESPYPIFAHEGRYYLRHEHGWYVGPGYNGPWSAVEERHVPPGLRGFHHERWREYQLEADRRFREDREEHHHPFYAGRPDERAYYDKHHGHGYDRDRHEPGHERHHRDEDQDRHDGRHRGRGDRDD